MVYPKNWRLEDELSTGKTFKSLDWVWYSYIWLRWCAFFNIVCHEDHHAWSHVSFTLVYAWKNSWIWSLRHFCMSWTRWFFGWCSIIYFRVEDWCIPFDYFWSRMWSGLGSIFSNPKVLIHCYWIGYPYNVAMWVDEMSCRKGVWKLITLWVRVTSDMPFLIVIVTCPIVGQFYARKIGRQHSTCWWRDLCSWPNDMVTVFY